METQIIMAASPVLDDFIKACQKTGLFEHLKLDYTTVANTWQTVLTTKQPKELFVLGEFWGIHQMRIKEANGGELPDDDETFFRLHKEVLAKLLPETV